jgi:hypothetical protein
MTCRVGIDHIGDGWAHLPVRLLKLRVVEEKDLRVKSVRPHPSLFHTPRPLPFSSDSRPHDGGCSGAGHHSHSAARRGDEGGSGDQDAGWVEKGGGIRVQRSGWGGRHAGELRTSSASGRRRGLTKQARALWGELPGEADGGMDVARGVGGENLNS